METRSAKNQIEFDEFITWIEVDGKRLQPYNVTYIEEHGIRTMSCWIASETGKVRCLLLPASDY
jgi:hypothetical protein